MTDKTEEFVRNFTYNNRQDNRILNITMEKAVGFGWYFTYDNRQDSRIWILDITGFGWDFEYNNK